MNIYLICIYLLPINYFRMIRQQRTNYGDRDAFILNIYVRAFLSFCSSGRLFESLRRLVFALLSLRYLIISSLGIRVLQMANLTEYLAEYPLSRNSSV